VTQAHSAARPHLSESLPVEEVLADLREALAAHGGAVLVAPPGAGKTTTVPLRLLDEPWLGGNKIVMLEPRRLAARAAARRMAEIIGDDVGGLIGYQTRDERRISSRARIEVVTEGVLTRRLQSDPSLDGVGLVIFDEVHERNVPTDVGLALLLDARQTLRPDLRVLAMSATAQADTFARLLGDTDGPAPIIASDGRMHPVDIRYVARRRDDSLEAAVATTVQTSLRTDDGDMLVFLPGIGEINRVRDHLLATLPVDVTVQRLAGALPFDEQDAALRPDARGRRRIVLSTDIAETSLTVDGVNVVIDAGLARVPRLDQRTGLTRLTTVTTSRASAEQRSGRAGRLRPGVAYRLWSRIEDSTRPAHLPPEISQVDLCSVVLEVAAWGSDFGALPFPDVPPQRSIQLARDTLRMLHAIDHDDRITPHGRALLTLPLHPRLASMVIHAHENLGDDAAWLACILAALVEERDIFRGRPDSLPADIALRASIVSGSFSDERADRGAVRRVADAARDIARRRNIDDSRSLRESVIAHLSGSLLLVAYPDRLAKNRGTKGQFVMRAGGGAWIQERDELATEAFIVAADVDGDRKTTRIRRGAGVDADQVALVLGDDVAEEVVLEWDKERNDLVRTVTRKCGSLRLDERTGPALADRDTETALVDRVRSTSLRILTWDDRARSTQRRMMFARRHLGDSWPNVSDKALVNTLDEWFAPYVAGCTCRADLEALDVDLLLRSHLSWDTTVELDSLVPATLTLPNNKEVSIDYSDIDRPLVSVRVQRVFGMSSHPTLLRGEVPIVMELLSPADRPIQVTSDLPGFWSGSWTDVRREMAGRYPKHDWPVDPTN